MNQCFTYDRYGNLKEKLGVNAVTLTTSTSTNHLTSGSAAYDARGNMTVFSSESMQYDLLNRNYKVTDTTLATDFVYLYDGAGERVGKFPSGGGALRRELARVIIEARGDTSLTCTPNPFTDVVCSSNPNDGKYVQKLKDIGISAGCGGGAYCPDTQIPREQAAVFFLLGKQCTVNVNNCTWTPPACTPPPNQRFADVPCPSTYADWIEELADEGITAGCPGGNFCPTLTLGSFQMLAWASVIWPTYAPLPRNTILTFRDEKGRVASESHQKSSSGDDTEVAIYERDNAFLGNLMISSVVWSGTNWTTPGWQFYSSDHLGSARLTTNTSAATVETKKYWPYGDEAATTGNAAQRLKFASMERDDEANHFYDHARHHDFNIGRFVAADLLGGSPRDPQSWNRYAYARMNPIKLVDPNGEYFVYAPGLSPSERQFLHSAPVGVVRRPSGRALFQKLQADPRRIVLRIGSLNSPDKIGRARFLKSTQTTLKTGETTFLHPVTQTVTTSLDAKVMREFGFGTGVDPGGVTTMAHELFHVDKALNSDLQTFQAGDDPTNSTGPAAKFGQSVFAERSDRSSSEAGSIVDEALARDAADIESLNELVEGSCSLTGVCFGPTTPR